MTTLEKPNALIPGSTIAIVAPAGPVLGEQAQEGLRAGIAALERAGFLTAQRQDLFAQEGFLAGDDARRAAEIMETVARPEVGAIFCARGGYGSARILPLLNAEKIRAAAKPLVGFSDITAMLLWQQNCAGLVGIHGPMLVSATDEQIEETLRLLGGELELPSVLQGRAGFQGIAQGRLTGGTLSVVAASLGTPWEVNTQGAILCIEEVNEQPYKLDRYLQQLKAAGKFDDLAGIALGQFTDCCDERYPAPSAEEVLREVFTEFDIPLVSHLPVGHAADNRPWPMGVQAEIDGAKGTLAVLESAVRKAV
jgi:muramoyltetrapeptide carboxypeptidase